jgi:hypothetical protein
MMKSNDEKVEKIILSSHLSTPLTHNYIYQLKMLFNYGILSRLS